jgi:hypothetical protein
MLKTFGRLEKEPGNNALSPARVGSKIGLMAATQPGLPSHPIFCCRLTTNDAMQLITPQLF